MRDERRESGRVIVVLAGARETRLGSLSRYLVVIYDRAGTELLLPLAVVRIEHMQAQPSIGWSTYPKV